MDQDIIDQLRHDRVHEAFELLVERYQHRVFRLACAITGSEAVAEEAAQESFIRMWKGIRGYRGDSALSTWIYSVTRNTCLTVRKSVRIETVPVEPWHLRTEMSRDSGPDWERLIAQLPEMQQAAVRLYYIEDKSYEEVAAMLAIPLGTVKTHLHRARKQLAIGAGATIGENHAV